MDDTHKHLICRRPFSFFSLLDNGNVVPCCPPWVDGYTYGNINHSSFDEVWNSDKAIKFRESILDGSFTYCNEMSCPMLSTSGEDVKVKEHYIKQTEEKAGPTDALIVNDIKNNKSKLDHGPLHIECNYDRSCNLSCPSCRDKTIMHTGNVRQNINDIQTEIIKNGASDVVSMTITASGDPFASPTFRKLLQTLTEDQCPKLEKIYVITNGLLLKRYWDTLSEFARDKIYSVSVSIDAASADVYHVNRRGGKWADLCENMDFVSYLRTSKKIHDFNASMVVQKNNFHEINDFILFCENHNVDMVQLQLYESDFGRDLGYANKGYSNWFEEWKDKAVQEKSHPDHSKLVDVLNDKFLESFIDNFNNWIEDTNYNNQLCLNLGMLDKVKKGIDISQFDSTYEEFQKWEEDRKLRARVKLGDLKDIWIDGTTYYVPTSIVRNVYGTDMAELPDKRVVKWDAKQRCWRVINPSSKQYKTYKKYDSTN